MTKAWRPLVPWLLSAALALGVFSTLQAYRLVTLDPKMRISSSDIGQLLALNLAFWFLWVLFTPAVVALARQFPLGGNHRLRNLACHGIFAIAFATVHFSALTGLRMLLWDSAGKSPYVPWSTFLQRIFFQNLDWALMTYGVIVGLSHAVDYYRESQERKIKEAHLETRLVEARLKTLEAELNPHFLFNTLHAISTLVHRDPDSADRMISRLSDLLRITFDRSGEGRIPLKEELEFLQKYLEIEQTRFQDRLSVTFAIDPETLDADVPRMLLQPLAENAVKHGIAPRPGPGHVQISSGREGDSLWIEVRDDGVGLNGGTLTALRTGVGLSNTRSRLQCLYGADYRLDFSNGHGLAVRVEIPFQRTAAPAAAATRVA